MPLAYILLRGARGFDRLQFLAPDGHATMSTSSPRLNMLAPYLDSHDITTVDGEPDPLTPSTVASAMRMGLYVTDRTFDRFLPRELRLWSSEHWTPLDAALRAAEWLDEFRVRRVVDIGSGAGKFCVAAALASRAHFMGVEHRPRFVDAARELARAFAVQERVSFVHASFGSGPALEADAYYLFNPFGENLFREEHQLDADVELSDARYVRDVAATERLLREAPVGTYLLTYNGFGGSVPRGYVGVRVDRELPCVLRMWRKNRASKAAGPAT